MDVFQKGSRFQCPWKSIHEGRGKKRETYLARVWTKRSGQGAHLWRFPRTSFQCQCKMKINFSLAMKLSVLSGPAFPWVSIQQASSLHCVWGMTLGDEEPRFWVQQMFTEFLRLLGEGRRSEGQRQIRKKIVPDFHAQRAGRGQITPPHTHTQPLFRGSQKKCLMTVKIKRKEYLELRTLCAQGPMQS